MPGHTFHEIYLHINWHTLGNRALLNPKLEEDVHQFIQERIHHTAGVFFHAVGGTATHVHLAVNIAPSVNISTMTGEIKGACSHEMNRRAGQQVVDWQRGFGIVSFGKKQLPWVKEYIAHQKEHHARGAAVERLEWVEEE